MSSVLAPYDKYEWQPEEIIWDGVDKSLRRQVQLNGQETWEDIPDQAKPAAGGGAMEMPPVPGGVPGFTAGGEPPRWDGSSPQPRVVTVPDDADDADWPQGRAVSQRPHSFPTGPQGMDGYWPAGQPQQQSGVSSPGGARGVPPSTVGKRYNPLEARGKHGEWEKVDGFVWVTKPGKSRFSSPMINHPDRGNGFLEKTDADGTMHVRFPDDNSEAILGKEIPDYGDDFKIIEPGSDAEKELLSRPDTARWQSQIRKVQSQLDKDSPNGAYYSLVRIRVDRLERDSALIKRMYAASAQIQARRRAGASSGRPLSLKAPDRSAASDPAAPFAKLTRDEKNAVDEYEIPRGGGAEIWNPALRAEDDRQLAAVQGDISLMDSAISKSWAKNDMTVYRGMSVPPGMTLKPGQEITDRAFGSVTDDESTARSFAYARAGVPNPNSDDAELTDMQTTVGTPTVMKIAVPRGYHMTNGDKGVNERILPRGTHYRVTSVDQDGIVSLEVILS
jgi:hypothetical protein